MGHHLRNTDGDMALRTIDFASHQSLVDEPHYQSEFHQRTAKQLAQRLLKALNPLLKRSMSNTKITELLREFTSIFSSALGLKPFAMISDFIFDFIWPARDSLFDDYRMEEVSLPKSEGKRHQTEQKIKRVVLVLVPGLCAYKYDRKLVDHCGFIAAAGKELGEARIIARAVVVTV